MKNIIDDKDLKILEELKIHAQYTTRQLAKRLLLPATTIHNHIQKLRKNGVIQRYTVELDYKKIGMHVQAHILIEADLPRLKEKKKTQHDMTAALKKIPGVQRAEIISGGADIIVFLRAKDMAVFDHLLLRKIQLVEGVKKTQTLMVISE